MARRSYLARVAQPLTAADPAVWSMPRAAMDEARPSIRVSAPLPSRTSPPVATPKPAIAGAAVPEEAAPKPQSAASNPPAPHFAPRFRTTPDGLDFADMVRPEDENTLEPAARVGPPTHPTPVEARNALEPAAAPVRSPSLSTPAGASKGRFQAPTITAPKAGTPKSVDGEASANTAAKSLDMTKRLAAINEVAPRPSGAPRENAARAASSGESPSASRSALIVASGREAPPRLHIGSIEIRMLQPPSPAAPTPVLVQAAAPAPAPAPLARPYASRFGLAQS